MRALPLQPLGPTACCCAGLGVALRLVAPWTRVALAHGCVFVAALASAHGTPALIRSFLLEMETEGDSPSPPDLEAFRSLVAAAEKRPPSASQQKFVKKLDNIPTVSLPVEDACRSALNLAERGLIGQFTGLWPSPKAVEDWDRRNWTPLVKEGIKSHFVGKGFFVFVFDSVEDRSLIFQIGRAHV